MRKVLIITAIVLLVFVCSCKNRSNNESFRLPQYDTALIFKEIDATLSDDKNLTKIKLWNIEKLGILWGFLKYYHPGLQTTKYNWDNQFFGILLKTLKAENSCAFDSLLEAWVDDLGKFPTCDSCSIKIADSVIKQMPHYGKIFNANYFPKSLTEKLKYLRDNNFSIKGSRYVRQSLLGNPEFINEPQYGKSFPNTGIRLLALFRYWNIIQYYYPYRYLVKDWDNILPEFVPQFIDVKNIVDYTSLFLRLITRVGDAHAGLYDNYTLDSSLGKFIIPVFYKYIQGKVVVSDFVTSNNSIANSFKRGDIIVKLDGTPVDSLIAEQLDITSGSNYGGKLYYMLYPGRSKFSRTNKKSLSYEIIRNGRTLAINVKTIPFDQHIKTLIEQKKTSPKYKIFEDSIGYINTNQLNNEDFVDVRRNLNNTKWLILDLRKYPVAYMPGQYGGWLKSKPSPFVKVSKFDIQKPGRFVFSEPTCNGSFPNIYNGRKIPDTLKYGGRIITLVNSETISRGEYTTMAFSAESIPGSLVIGNTTAGADGDVSLVSLPGNIETYISGVGIYYPNGDETQRVGVKIDISAEQTIHGIKENSDEILDKAFKTIKKQLTK